MHLSHPLRGSADTGLRAIPDRAYQKNQRTYFKIRQDDRMIILYL